MKTSLCRMILLAIMAAVVTLLSTPVLAQDTVVAFPDPNLEAVIREAIGKPTGNIYQSDLLQLTTLNATYRDITNLSGMECCLNLDSLYIDYNQISDLSPLASLTSLYTLDLSNNQISDISPLDSLNILINLYLSSNEVSDISSLSSLTNLGVLIIHNNQISDLSPVSDLVGLRYIDVSANQIDDISSLEKLTNLESLILWGNDITNITVVEGFINLHTLSLGMNQITDISSVAQLNNLQLLWLGSNTISDISPIIGLVELRDFRADNNLITDISPLSNLTNLTNLALGSNRIGDISSLSNLTELTDISIADNQISDISPLVENTGIGAGDYIDLHENPLSNDSIEIHIPALQSRGVEVIYDDFISVNNSPVLDSIGNKSIMEGELLEFTISATDPDDDPVTYSASNLPSGASFDTQTGTFSWTPTSGQAGTYTNVRFEVSDGELTDYEEITITVLSTDNSPPVIEQSNTHTLNVLATAKWYNTGIDISSGDEIIFSASGQWCHQTGAPLNGPEGIDALATSEYPLPGVRGFSLIGKIGNSPPFYIGSSLNATSTYSGRLYLSMNDSDFGDNDGQLTVIIHTVSPSLSLPLRVNAAGEAYVDTQGNTWQADQAFNPGSWGHCGTDFATDHGTDIAISNTSDDRIYQSERWALSGYRFDLGSGVYTVILHFAETHELKTGPGQRIFDVSIEGQLVLDDLDIYSEAGFSTALVKEFNGIVVQDTQLNIEFASSVDQPMISGIEIFTDESNNAPTLNSISNQSVNEGELLEFTILATDPDGDPLTYSASNLPEGASFDMETRTFSWTPNSNDVGIYENVHFQVSDGELNDSEEITITVTILGDSNHAPVLSPVGNKSVRVGERLEFNVSATDPDGNLLMYYASNLPSGASFNAMTRTFSWTPASGQAGTYKDVHFEVSDRKLADSEDITITVSVVGSGSSTFLWVPGAIVGPMLLMLIIYIIVSPGKRHKEAAKAELIAMIDEALNDEGG